MSRQFVDWATAQLSLCDEDVARMQLGAAFELFTSRIETARHHGAADPLTTVTAKDGGGNSRATTRRMLDQLRYKADQRRAMHRLMAASPCGWPGLLVLYATQQNLDAAQLRYAHRQVAAIVRSDGGVANARTSDPPS